MTIIKWNNNSTTSSTSIVVLFAIVVLTTIRFASGARPSPDIGLCETVVNNTADTIDCVSGTANFCCLKELVKTVNNVNKWTRRCCKESEYVLQNA